MLGHAVDLGESPAKDELDVRVEAAEFIGRPARQGVMDGRIDTQQDRFAVPPHE